MKLPSFTSVTTLCRRTGGSPAPLADPVARCGAKCDAAPAELAAVMGERAETGYVPLLARPAVGDAARCGAVPQPDEPAAETGVRRC